MQALNGTVELWAVRRPAEFSCSSEDLESAQISERMAAGAGQAAKNVEVRPLCYFCFVSSGYNGRCRAAQITRYELARQTRCSEELPVYTVPDLLERISGFVPALFMLAHSGGYLGVVVFISMVIKGFVQTGTEQPNKSGNVR